METHYTPKIEEFHVGFEYEVRWETDEFQPGEENKRYITWEKRVCSMNFPEPTLPMIDTAIKGDGIRVKFLDHSDLKSLGFENIGGKMVGDGDSEFMKNLGRLYIYIEYWKFNFSPILSIKTSVAKFSDKTTVCHSIRVKNKSELIKILEQNNLHE